MNFLKKVENFIKDISNKLDANKNGTKKNMINLIILALFGILLVICASLFKSNSAATSSVMGKEEGKSSQIVNTNSTGDYEITYEEDLKKILERIQGVGQVEVMVTLEGGEEKVPAININDSTSTTTEKDNEGGTRENTQKNNGSTVVITSDGSKNEPLIVKTYKPKVSGVVVVAQGAEDKKIQAMIMNAVVGLWSLPENKVNVYPMKK